MSRNNGLFFKIALSFAAFVLIGANDGAFGVVLPGIQQSYDINKSTVSLMFLFGTSGYLLSALSSGMMVEKLGARAYLALGPALLALGAAGPVARLPFVALLFTTFVMAMGTAIIDAGLNSFIAGLPNNTRLLNYLHAFYGLGALIGPLVASGFLAAEFAWNWVYAVWMAAGVLVMVGTWLRFKGQGRAATRKQAEKLGAKQGNVLASALRLRATWFAAIFLLFYVGAEVSLGSWSYSLLTEERGMLLLFGGWTVSGYWMGLTLGRLIMGRVSHLLDDKMLIQVCLAGVLAGLLMVWLAPHGFWPLEVFGLWLTGFSLGPIFPTTIAFLSRVLPARVLAGAIGFVASAGSAGAALFPWLAGNLAQGSGLWTLMPYVIGLSLVSLVFWLLLQAQPSAPVEPAETAPAS